MKEENEREDLDLGAEAAELLERARAIPGVAEVLRVYGEHERFLAAAAAYSSRSLVATSTTGNRTL